MRHFPTSRFTTNSPAQQARHVVSEAFETLEEAARGHVHMAAEEAWDVIHSAETLLAILASVGVDVEAARAHVEAKNRDRGYYEEDGCDSTSR